ncbi:hypothetical protein A2954_02955 [Candidatus Roizmanbacteria bacterium RIFCSPLOWO2_01_FULL_37_12]|uniref:Diaminopimelate epimerase n=1 Tax=Candidatus Roizmanbacteria bacterium RIFCSPLOWO2_01_FULL_37_12 TaxID=1802056 RepID=A0A1F7IAG4_9BACT|nr:MAG: hypothetical protein A3D76_04385 [Candidatus Roizmanbacteria bacterium RIFCSPHIGHO2_02_FULL_37_9b]OGK40336.1 MAG: hypothetical protein A2954_02955 [Candidatus Roizmanbacteria bacterium RIFCSPLOWO2_01_FULL_37_12]
MLKKYNISLVRPGGNDTAIINGFIPNGLRKVLNKEIIRKFPNVEQCGFYEQNENKTVNFCMMGGEFSGNAILALTYLILKGESGKLTTLSSGAKKVIQSGINENKSVYSEIPIFKSYESVMQLTKNIFLVRLRGIKHLVVYKKISKDKSVTKAKKLLEKYGLIKYKCSGCIFVEKEISGVLRINPIVWIRDVKTLTYETACGSGATAVGLSILKNSILNKISLKIKQPSGNYISVNAQKNRDSFTKVVIEGKVELIKPGQNFYLEV